MHYLLVIPCWYMAEWTQSQPLPNLQEAIQIPLSKEIAQGRIADNEGFRRGRKTYLFPKNKQGNSLLGLSVLYRPYPLYGYDVLRDSVFDAIRQFKISSPSFSRSYHTELISLADWNPRGAANIFALSSSVDTKIVIKGQLRRRLPHSFSPRCIIVLWSSNTIVPAYYTVDQRIKTECRK